MGEKVRCETCGKAFKSHEGLEMHKKAIHPKPEKKVSKTNYKKIRNWVIFIVIFGLLIWGVSTMFTGIKTLPPTTMQGHIESSPISHVIKQPMSVPVQKHMLEHADGTGPPGIIINYNCEDYDCESGLIENLESFAEKYPANVYVAPFPDMDAKIVLTRLNRIEILEQYNEATIESFILDFSR